MSHRPMWATRQGPIWAYRPIILKFSLGSHGLLRSTMGLL
ncbi:Rho GTPase-activating gacM [Gossypium arboreum]|uniref:Rho GTPase-activating gacM n=1 Tax=Gossypium arboreum TaxID=29729 RepID=A0A0B0N306_GOSAR|nr:Rho GTPase-activating gacM [Gossypium arboreum]